MLRFAARQGRWCLVAGLAAGLTLPALAEALRPHLPLLIAALLFLAAFRIGPHAIWGGLRAGRTILALVLIYQIALPLTVLGLAHLAGLAGTTAVLAAVLMFSAPSVTGAANFALMMQVKPEAALRLLMVGTTLFPVTVLPVLVFLPELDGRAVLTASGRLIGLVLMTGLAVMLLRRGRLKTLTPAQEQNLDGASAILLGVTVIGLMSAVGPLLATSPASFALWLGFAVALNFSAQLLAWQSLARRIDDADRPAISIVAGNRNIALFLVALPPEISVTLLSFIGCYQIPMYLTPILFRRLYQNPG